MEKFRFSPHRIGIKQRQKRGVIIVVALFVAIMIGFFAPRIWQKVRVLAEEYRIQKGQEEIASLPEISFKAEEVSDGFLDAPQLNETSPSEEFLAKLEALGPEELPAEKILAVPYICQNPYRNESGWDVHDASCEEAALLQAYLYYTGETVSADEANAIILDMIRWEEKEENFGGHIDLYGDDMMKMITGYYGIPEDEVVHLTKMDTLLMKKVITLGYPLITPIQGELLRNPFYPYPGYHMLTIIGYSGDTVITNDVGTKRGEKYPYSFERLLNANSPVGNDAFVILSVQKTGDAEKTSDGESRGNEPDGTPAPM